MPEGEDGGGGIGGMIQSHPGLIIGGAVGLGLLFFMTSGSRGAAQQETGLTPISQDTGEGYMTTDEFNAALEEYDSRIRDYIDGVLQGGGTPDPDQDPQNPHEQNPPSPGPGPGPGPGGGFNWPGHQGPYGPQQDPPCPPGYHWSSLQGTCVQNDPFGR